MVINVYGVNKGYAEGVDLTHVCTVCRPKICMYLHVNVNLRVCILLIKYKMYTTMQFEAAVFPGEMSEYEND